MTTTEQIDPHTRIPFTKLYGLVDELENNSWESKSKKKIFNVSAIPTFNLGIDDDSQGIPRSPYEGGEVDTKTDLTDIEEECIYIHALFC